MSVPTCQSCMKFASMDEPEIEHEDLDVDDMGMLTGTVEAMRRTACCGDDAKQAHYEIEGQIDHECDKEEDEEADHGFEMEDTKSKVLGTWPLYSQLSVTGRFDALPVKRRLNLRSGRNSELLTMRYCTDEMESKNHVESL